MQNEYHPDITKASPQEHTKKIKMKYLMCCSSEIVVNSVTL
jgi:hypothetical protein